MKIFSILFFFVFILSCNSQDNPDTQNESKPKGRQSSPVNCYEYASRTDTIALKLIHVGDSITGTLVYQLKEKDKNKGTILGYMRDNVLVADYTFMSEGIQSVRQVAFKLDGNTFIEGYGESVDRNGKMVFRNLDSLEYSSFIRLSEVACE